MHCVRGSGGTGDGAVASVVHHPVLMNGSVKIGQITGGAGEVPFVREVCKNKFYSETRLYVCCFCG